MNKLTSILIYGILGAVLLFASYLLFLGSRNIWRGLASPHWPKVMGLVTSSDTEQATTVDAQTRRTDVMYSANVAFRYKVNGHEYTTKLLYFGQTTGSGDPTEAELRSLRYPMGAEVPIFYNPHDPSIAAAEPGFHAESLLLVLAGLMFGLPCLMAAAVMGGGSSQDGLDFGFGIKIGLTFGLGTFAAIFAMFGIGALSLGLINLWRGYASESWPQVPGVITYQTLDASQADGGGATYSDHLIFVYTVDGKKRYSNLRRFGLLAGGAQESAESAKERYPANAAVTVSYSRDNPNLGVLEPGIDSQAYILPGIGLVVLLFALAVCVFGIPALTGP